MSNQPVVDRGISPMEIAVIRATIERAPEASGWAARAVPLGDLRVIGQCSCGCDSVEFTKHDPARPPRPVAQGLGTTPAGAEGGVIVWGTDDAVTGLEVFDMTFADDDTLPRLPEPDSIRPWPKADPHAS
jgi:hypothetical protein